MISMTRKIIIKVNQYATKQQKVPPFMTLGQYYAVVGYSVQMRKREERKEHEEIEAFYFINDRSEVAFIYCSYCDVQLDPMAEEIANSKTLAQGGANGGKG